MTETSRAPVYSSLRSRAGSVDTINRLGIAIMPPRLSGKGVKSGGPPVFSVEFFIANHADIISTFCTIIFVGLVFQVSSTALSLLARAAGACMAAAACIARVQTQGPPFWPCVRQSLATCAGLTLSAYISTPALTTPILIRTACPYCDEIHVCILQTFVCVCIHEPFSMKNRGSLPRQVRYNKGGDI